MNRQILTAFILALVLLFIFSPFASLALLMLALLTATTVWMLAALVQGLLSSPDQSQ